MCPVTVSFFFLSIIFITSISNMCEREITFLFSFFFIVTLFEKGQCKCFFSVCVCKENKEGKQIIRRKRDRKGRRERGKEK